jgi:hypothetical protein
MKMSKSTKLTQLVHLIKTVNSNNKMIKYSKDYIKKK